MDKLLIDAFIFGINLTVDEQFVTFQGRYQFIQYSYIPSKTGKYGIKIWVTFDGETNYCLKMDIYTRKEANESRATNLGYSVIMRLIKPFKISSQNITCDNFFTSLNLGRKLLQKINGENNSQN